MNTVKKPNIFRRAAAAVIGLFADAKTPAAHTYEMGVDTAAKAPPVVERETVIGMEPDIALDTRNSRPLAAMFAETPDMDAKMKAHMARMRAAAREQEKVYNRPRRDDDSVQVSFTSTSDATTLINQIESGTLPHQISGITAIPEPACVTETHRHSPPERHTYNPPVEPTQPIGQDTYNPVAEHHAYSSHHHESTTQPSHVDTSSHNSSYDHSSSFDCGSSHHH